MIRPHILADHQAGTAADPGAAEFALFPRVQAFPREVARDIVVEKPGQDTPSAPMNVGGEFPELEWWLVLQKLAEINSAHPTGEEKHPKRPDVAHHPMAASVLRFPADRLSIAAMKFLPLLMMAFGALVIGCERHDFEETKKLHDRSAPVSVDDEGEGETQH